MARGSEDILILMRVMETISSDSSARLLNPVKSTASPLRRSDVPFENHPLQSGALFWGLSSTQLHLNLRVIHVNFPSLP